MNDSTITFSKLTGDRAVEIHNESKAWLAKQPLELVEYYWKAIESCIQATAWLEVAASVSRNPNDARLIELLDTVEGMWKELRKAMELRAKVAGLVEPKNAPQNG